MIAYNTEWLNNLFIRQQAMKAFQQDRLLKEEWENISNKYPLYFYSPNFFIRIGLFTLTTIILLFSFGLLSLLFLDSIDHAVGGLAIFFGIFSYGALEYMVQVKKHFQSGVDDALLWSSAGCIFGGISYLANAGGLANCLLIFMISFYCCLRFADRLMSVVAYISLAGIFFFVIIRAGPAVKPFVPFVLMAISAGIYWLAKKLDRSAINQLYLDCLQVVSVAALLGFYFAGNYYVVRELSISLFNLTLAPSESIPFGWFFWLFTMLVPCVYIGRGIRKKDMVLLRVGLLLTAVIILTIRYYHFIAPVEVMLTVGGIVLVAVSYTLTRYLKTPKYGFTSLETASAGEREKRAIESLLLAQTFAGSQPATDGSSFGGGNFGGGGASGEF